MMKKTTVLLATSLVFAGACSSGPTEEDDDLPDEATQEIEQTTEDDDGDSTDETVAEANDDPGRFGDPEFINTLLQAHNTRTTWECRCDYDGFYQNYRSADECTEEELLSTANLEGYSQCIVDMIGDATPYPEGFQKVIDPVAEAVSYWQDCASELEETYGDNCSEEAAQDFDSCLEQAFEIQAHLEPIMLADEFQYWLDYTILDELDEKYDHCLPEI